MNRKILLVRATPNDLDINGYNVQQVGLGKAFCDMGYNYDFITFKKKSPRNEFVFYEHNGYRAKCIELPRFRFFRWGLNTKICNKDFLKQYDIIICQEYYQLQTYLMSKKSDNVVMYSGPYYNIFMPKILSPIYDKFITKKLNRNLAAKFVKSKLAQDFLEKKGYTNLHDIGVALDISRFENNIDMFPETHKIVQFMRENKCVLSVGTLCERKNFPFILNVFKAALEKDPELKLVIIGKSKINPIKKILGKKDDDYALKYFRKLQKNVKEGILHINRIDNSQLKYIYPLAKAFLLPSKLEIFGMVLLEAMCLKTPVITSLNGGSITLISGKNTGVIIPEFNIQMWVNSIFKYINEPEYTEMVVENASRLVRDEYNWDVLAKKFLDIKRN